MLTISRPLFRRGLSAVVTSKSSHTAPEEKIEIPTRIPRGPTDILRALESTVGRDPTAAHYKYHDDPYLIPLSSSGKRVFAMAQEAGRKAAHWVRAQHSDLFLHREADPFVELFAPPVVYNENSEASVDDLGRLIKMGQIDDAVLVFGILEKKGENVGDDLRQGLLELLAYRNGEDSVGEEFIEERWFKQGSKGKEIARKTWKDGDFAEKLFENMSVKTPQSYCALIQGMAKYRQIDRAMLLYEECQKNNITLNTNAYNALLSSVNFHKESFELRLPFLMELLNEMSVKKIKPNLGTLNATLYSLSFIGKQQVAKEYVLRTLSEFKLLGIEPSIAAWHYVLVTFCKERGPVSTILHDILNHLENKEFEIRDLNDVKFFVFAMEICRRHLNDVALAQRLNRLLHYGNNYNLIGDSYKESVYYRHYLALLCANLPFDEFMTDVYSILVPHIYVPEMGIMEEILKQLDINANVEYVPKLWSDMIVFDFAHREKLVDIVLNVMVNNKELLNDDLNEKFAKIAWDMYTKSVTEEDMRIHRLNLTGDMLGKILMLLCRGKSFEKACTIMDKLDKEQQTVAGVPSLEALQLFVDLCIEEKIPSRAIDCIQYCVDCGFPEAKSLGVKLHKELNLDEVFLGKLTKVVGDLNLD